MPKAQFLDSNDTTGSYFTLNPDKASKFWMPDVFIDQAKALKAVERAVSYGIIH